MAKVALITLVRFIRGRIITIIDENGKAKKRVREAAPQHPAKRERKFPANVAPVPQNQFKPWLNNGKVDVHNRLRDAAALRAVDDVLRGRLPDAGAVVRTVVRAGCRLV